MEKTIDSSLVYDGCLLKVHKDNIVAQNGSHAVREYITHPGGVCILGFIDEKAVIERQFRYPYKTEIIELPAGKIEKNEHPMNAAKREFEEETGYHVDSIISLGEFYPTVAYTDEIIHLYFANKISKGSKNLDEDESIDINLMPLDEIIEKIKSNEIKDGKTVALIYKYLLFRDELK